MATVRHFLDLHTGYVTPRTSSMLAENSIAGVVVNELERGFLVFAGITSKAAAAAELNFNSSVQVQS